MNTFGDDPFGHYIREELTARGVDTRGVLVDPHRPTGVTVVLSRRHDRAMLTALGWLLIAPIFAKRLLGFLPGQAYMGDVPAELALARRESPPHVSSAAASASQPGKQ